MKFKLRSLEDLEIILKKERLDYFFLDTSFTETDVRELRLELKASFLPCPVDHGLVVKGDVFIGCTGATLQLRAIEAAVNDYSKTSYITVTARDGSIEQEHGTFNASAGSASLNKGTRNAKNSEAFFVSQEGHLIATPRGDDFVNWSFFAHRGRKAVRDYLEGCLEVFAQCSWGPDNSPRLVVSGKATDRRFFSNSRRQLSKLKSVALAAKLLAKGVKLPEQRNFFYLIEEAK